MTEIARVVGPGKRYCIEFREERMDGNEFDQISRKLGALATRRRALGGLAAGLAAAAGLAGVAEAKNKAKQAHAESGKKLSAKKIGKEQCGSNGCVLAGVLCAPGTAFGVCGQNGTACTACTAGQVCSPNATGTGGTCVTQLNCAAGTCQTTTAAGQQCVAFGQPNTCGVNAAAIGPKAPNTVCGPRCQGGQTCNNNSANGTCSGTTCASICPTGCCTAAANGALTCNPGTNVGACGSAGATCTDCTNGGLFQAQCNALPGGGGQCSNVVTPCGPANCAGCCTTGGACANGNAQGACGSGGAACVACATGQVCNGSACVSPPPTCTPANCTGCCQGTTCITTPSDAACGLGGVTCQVCTGKKHCKNGSTCKKKHHKH